jgi:hypothetical protein
MARSDSRPAHPNRGTNSGSNRRNQGLLNVKVKPPISPFSGNPQIRPIIHATVHFILQWNPFRRNKAGQSQASFPLISASMA